MNNQDYDDQFYNNPDDVYYRKQQQYINNQQQMNNNEQQNIPYNTIYSNHNQNNYEKGNVTSSPSKERLKYSKMVIPFVIILVLISSLVIGYLILNRSGEKNRTFMIYMVGSDLESKSKQGTYSISDIVGENIDLDNNNVVLITGGASKWHNFVEADEIGIYELTYNGFKKKKSLPVESMGSSDTLETFLKYSYDNYPSKKYDMIFWNHGLGAIGIEQDELAKDFLSINELNKAFSNSAFKDEKLELTIFYNCLASNLHIANIMKDYSDYMVASEEILYLSKNLNRLNFLENVQPEDSAYDVGYLFVKQSDKVVDSYNSTHTKGIDSTLSIIDLSKIDTLKEKLNDYMKSISLKNYYYAISNLRRKMHTYGITQTYDYDTVDLYGLVESLGEITNTKQASNSVLSAINDAITYTSNLNNYSNGISVYFPYFGSDTAIETHLSMFEKISNDNYFNFINNFYQIRSGTKRSRQSINMLTNRVTKENDTLTIELTDDEKKQYQDANIYIFKKINDTKYELEAQSNDLKLNGNKLTYSNNKLLKINDELITYDLTNKTVYGKLYDKDDTLDVKYSIENNKVNEVILDSNNYISSGIVEYDDYKDLSFAKLSYTLFENGTINEDWKTTKEKAEYRVTKDNLKINLDNNVGDYFVLVEMYDIYNDTYYSNLEYIGL